MKVYEMEMEFSLQLAPKKINDFIGTIGLGGKLVTSGHVMTLSQALPFVPDDAYIQQVSNVIKENFGKESGELEVVDCSFKGYTKFLEKEIEE